MDGQQIRITKRINLFFVTYHKILWQLFFILKNAKFYRLFTGVIFPQAESLRDDGVGVGVLLFVFAC